jgi:HPr kinase/phosphorylase
MTPTLHASAILVGADGVLIRGPSGSGKTALALAIVERITARGGFAALVADDRVRVTLRHGRLVARPPDTLKGLVERRGLGVVAISSEAAAVIALVVDIVDQERLERFPREESRRIAIEGVTLPHLDVPHDPDWAASLVMAALGTRSGGVSV